MPSHGGEAEPVGVEFGPVATIWVGFVNQAEQDAVAGEAERLDGDVAEPRRIELVQEPGEDSVGGVRVGEVAAEGDPPNRGGLVPAVVVEAVHIGCGICPMIGGRPWYGAVSRGGWACGS